VSGAVKQHRRRPERNLLCRTERRVEVMEEMQSQFGPTRQTAGKRARQPRTGPALLVVIPVYNDWDAVSLVLADLDSTLATSGISADVLLVDDGSTLPVGDRFSDASYQAMTRVQLLQLRRNLGHQRAIAIALAYAYDQYRPDTVLVMDGDGEDAPKDVPSLLERLREAHGREIVFAARQRRSESLAFRVFYSLYRLAHFILTGIPVRVGNFSVIPGALLGRLVVVSELWNHYAAAVFKARLPHDSIPTTRARRLTGRSSMNFVALVGHGLSALSVHAELIGVRLLVSSIIAIAIVSMLLVTVVGVRLLTSLAIPGWATTAAGLLGLTLLQFIGAAVFFIFLVLHGRSQPLFIPIRDYPFFIETSDTLYPMLVTRAAGAEAPCRQ
jgi:glycosyltransferase involved in cell wall biosynthesis